jgi:hypothetical protein
VSAFGIVMFSPAFNDDLRVTERGEDFTARVLITELPVAA